MSNKKNDLEENEKEPIAYVVIKNHGERTSFELEGSNAELIIMMAEAMAACEDFRNIIIVAQKIAMLAD